jgi:AcrR family transcriptional regulator
VADGYEAFNTNRVAEIAGVSVGSLYQYFPNKLALVSALWQAHHEELQVELDCAFDAAEELPLGAAVRGLIEASIRAHQIAPDLHRVLSTGVPEIDFSDVEGSNGDAVMTRFRDFLARYSNELRPGLDITTATVIVASFGETMTHGAVIDRPEMLEVPGFVDELTHMVMTYLTTPPKTV